ncbi:hypothetical protein [Kribbella sp. NPDC050470]|uniref:hypothetical protein n=1 Tax=unclassified Kribbella TaxID=2644121 RepID=UPI00378A2901
MAHVLDQVPVGRITKEAREVRFSRTVLAVIAGVLYGIGWLTAKLFGLVWFAVAWAGTAVKIGWTDARGGGGRGAS